MSVSKVDYGPLVKGRLYNLTVYRYCPYQCVYCWSWRVPLFRTRVQRGKYDPVEAASKIPYGNTILISFTSDPFPPAEREEKRTRSVLEALADKHYACPRGRLDGRVLVLTKNPGLCVERDLDLFVGDTWLGSTVITLREGVVKELEPRAPPASERLAALKTAKGYNIKTFLSIEPIIPSASTDLCELVEKTADYVDFYILGALNYARQLGFNYTRRELQRFYRENIPPVLELLEQLGKKHHVKRELREHLEEAVD